MKVTARSALKTCQNISIVSFYGDEMNLIESGIQLAGINLAWNLSSAILGGGGGERAPTSPHYLQSDLEDL